MSLYAALLTGVSGLNANSRALSITSSNIANVNTVGFKASTAGFSTFVASSGGGGGISPASVNVEAKQQVQKQGLLTSTGSGTDLAISGNGFFIVTNDPTNPNAMAYTRAGSFKPDSEGFLRNSAGYYLEGWTLNPDGSLPANRSALSAIDLSSLNGTADETSSIRIRANLKASAVVGPDPEFQQTINIYDSQGGARPMQLSFTKTGANTWDYEVTYQGAGTDLSGAITGGTGTITFNSDGTLATPAGGNINLTIPWDTSTGLVPQAVTLNVGTVGDSDGVTQFDSASTLTSVIVDGAPFGSLTSVSVDEEGIVTALFDNGLQRQVFKIPVAMFANPNGLLAISGNAYQITRESGALSILEAKTGGAGEIASSSLESSTADLAQEFTDLITTQRAYSAATKIITTADDMLQELMQVKR